MSASVPARNVGRKLLSICGHRHAVAAAEHHSSRMNTWIPSSEYLNVPINDRRLSLVPEKSRFFSTLQQTRIKKKNISSRNKEYLSSSASSSSKANLRIQTTDWSKLPVGSWSLKDISKGRFLIRQWSDIEVSDSERALQQTKILHRWLQEFQSTNTKCFEYDDESALVELREILHRCLDSWRNVNRMRGREMNAYQAAVRSLEHFEKAARNHLPDHQNPANAKTYSMCINVLARYPEYETSCQDILSIYGRCNQKDLQMYNVCVMALAKCSAFHQEAPFLAEEVFRDVQFSKGNNNRKKNCLFAESDTFVALLHAWANASRIRPDGAQRCEAILKQMITSHVHLVNTNCFNIVIDAWARQGFWKEAEAVLWKMFGLYQQHRRENLRPNVVSFNSTIHACAKSKNKNDSEEAAVKAEELLEQMLALECNPTMETLTNVMQAFLRTSNPGPKLQSMLDTLEDRYAKGYILVAPEKVCYLLAIQAWGQTAKYGPQSDRSSVSAENAERLFRRMQEIVSTDPSRSDLDPCVVVYTALIDCWAKTKSVDAPDHVLRLFEEMHSMSQQTHTSHITPNNVTVNVVVNALCQHGRTDKACELLQRLNDDRQADLKAYHTILRAYAASGREDAAKRALLLLHEIEESLWLDPTAETYSLVLMSLGNSLASDAAIHAENFFWRLIHEKRSPSNSNVRLVNGVLRAWAKSSQGGAAERAEQFLERVINHPVDGAPDGISHLHLIQAWARSGRRNAKRKAEYHLERILSLTSEEANRAVVGRAHAAIAKIRSR
ncbi:PPR: pentatricopeptide repeat domain containing protein [Nitzschia inconspicua]|uniref:PPR: pentatricopeptide repeat domain containing protein n=1 Tax=Nitzschia inconspicua TaxID=303405 RepID=A0A9K3KE99_9STRA|nr:PPR: pentatricopeptide repeat domain containing protein [Nitzschia inconspicua]